MSKDKKVGKNNSFVWSDEYKAEGAWTDLRLKRRPRHRPWTSQEEFWLSSLGYRGVSKDV